MIKPGTRYVASHNKRTLIITEAKPKVTTLIGKKMSLRTGLTRENKIVTTTAAITKVTQFENEMVGKNHAKMASTTAVRTNGLNMQLV